MIFWSNRPFKRSPIFCITIIWDFERVFKQQVLWKTKTFFENEPFFSWTSTAGIATFPYKAALSKSPKWTYHKGRGSLVGTGHKLIVHKTFRGRPGRLLNVWCTFILRPVSTSLHEFLHLSASSFEFDLSTSIIIS